MCQVIRGDGDEIDSEGFLGERPGGVNVLGQQFGVHIAAGQDAECAGIADRGYQVRGAHPGHGPADNRVVHAQEFLALGPELVKPFGVCHIADNIADWRMKSRDIT